VNQQSLRFLELLGAENLAQLADRLHTSGLGVFQPTATTSGLLTVAKKHIKANSRLLDLGCGWGILGLEIALSNSLKQVCMSDVSHGAYSAARHNADLIEEHTDVRVGSLFEPWVGEKFDAIISDVSGVSQQIPFLSEWFDGIPCDSGNDGLRLVEEVIKESGKYLETENSILIMPLISLSDVNRGEELMRSNFRIVNRAAQRFWSLKIDNQEQQQKLDVLKSKNFIDFEIKDDSYTFYTNIYLLSQPIG
jgi:methylase of polypeptide subunit release factors